MRTYAFNEVAPAIDVIPKVTTLYKHPHQPILLKKVASFAEALACGGVYVQHESGRYAFFLGDSARDAIADGVFFYDTGTDCLFAPGDGAASKYGDPTTANGPWPLFSGTYEASLVSSPASKLEGKIYVMAVISNASYGYGTCDRLLRVQQSKAQHVGGFWLQGVSYPGPNAGGGFYAGAEDDADRIRTSWGWVRNDNAAGDLLKPENAPFHRGSVVVSVATHKRSHAIIIEQTPKIIEGAGQGEKYVKTAIAEYLANSPDEILYVPMVASWIGNDEITRRWAVGHTVEDRVFGAGDEPSPWGWSGGGIGQRMMLYPGAQTAEFARYTAATPPSRPVVPGNGSLVDAAWFVIRSFEGAAYKMGNAVVPSPYFASEMREPTSQGVMLAMQPTVTVGLDQSVTAYAGIDTAFLLKGALPYLVQDENGVRRPQSWSGAYPLSVMLAAPVPVKMPERTLESPPLSQNPTPSELKNAALAVRASKDITVQGVVLRKSWSTFWNPIKRLESIIVKIYDRAVDLAEADQ